MSNVSKKSKALSANPTPKAIQNSVARISKMRESWAQFSRSGSKLKVNKLPKDNTRRKSVLP